MQNFSSGLPSETKTQVGGLANNVAALLAYFPCIAVIARYGKRCARGNRRTALHASLPGIGTCGIWRIRTLHDEGVPGTVVLATGRRGS
jgi:hypothetical protein